jgi:hypothetical protein
MAFLSWKAKDGKPGGTLQFDLTVAETIISSASMTTFPVEQGADISDHVRQEADKCTLEVYVSNSPIRTDNLIDPSSPRGGVQSVTLDLPKFNFPLLSGLGILRRLGSLFSAGDTPTKALLLTFDTPFNAPGETLDVLRQLQSEARLIEVYGRDWFLDDMVLMTISNPRNSETGDGGEYTLEFSHIRIVETQRTTSPVSAEPRAKTPASNGAKGSKDAKPELKSTAFGVIEGIKGFFGGGGAL